MGCNTSTATIDSPPNMPSTYKLVYFNMRGRAEISRLLFNYAGVKFEDCRMTFEEYGANKSDISRFPTGKCPSCSLTTTHPSHSARPSSASSPGSSGYMEITTSTLAVST